MAITPLYFREMLKRAQGGMMICAGYPDLLISSAMMSEFLPAVTFPVREDARKIIQWHGAQKWLDTVYDSKAVFTHLGFHMDVLDVGEVRGGEIVADLNYPLSLQGTYDWVLDFGTCEHVFHVGRAMMSMASLVKAQGLIFQLSPLSAPNHGFWNVSPTLVVDFYDNNGFTIEYLKAVSGPVEKQLVWDVPMFKSFIPPPGQSWLFTIARRNTVTPMVAPMQRKYVLSPTLSDGPSRIDEEQERLTLKHGLK
jgi:hypothetical protein